MPSSNNFSKTNPRPSAVITGDVGAYCDYYVGMSGSEREFYWRVRSRRGPSNKGSIYWKGKSTIPAITDRVKRLAALPEDERFGKKLKVAVVGKREHGASVAARIRKMGHEVRQFEKVSKKGIPPRWDVVLFRVASSSHTSYHQSTDDTRPHVYVDGVLRAIEAINEIVDGTFEQRNWHGTVKAVNEPEVPADEPTSTVSRRSIVQGQLEHMLRNGLFLCDTIGNLSEDEFLTVFGNYEPCTVGRSMLRDFRAQLVDGKKDIGAALEGLRDKAALHSAGYAVVHMDGVMFLVGGGVDSILYFAGMEPELTQLGLLAPQDGEATLAVSSGTVTDDDLVITKPATVVRQHLFACVQRGPKEGTDEWYWRIRDRGITGSERKTHWTGWATRDEIVDVVRDMEDEMDKRVEEFAETLEPAQEEPTSPYNGVREALELLVSELKAAGIRTISTDTLAQVGLSAGGCVALAFTHLAHQTGTVCGESDEVPSHFIVRSHAEVTCPSCRDTDIYKYLKWMTDSVG